MSIAEKLTQIAENEQKALTAFANINTALTEKGVSTADTLADVPGQIDSIKAEPMWLPYIQNLRMAFNEVVFPIDTELVFDVPNLQTDMTYLLRAAKNVKKVTLICDNWQYASDESQSVSMHQAFTYIYELETIDMTRFNVFLGDCRLMASAYSLREILGNLNLSRARLIYDAFNTQNLETIRIVPGTAKLQLGFSNCSKLTDESIQSIIDGLADLTGQAAQTVTFHATVGAKLTDEQKATITAKNWTLVY